MMKTSTGKPKRSVKERALDAETRANQWLGDANEARDSGDAVEEARCLDKCQFWLDRANLLNGRGERGLDHISIRKSK